MGFEDVIVSLLALVFKKYIAFIFCILFWFMSVKFLNERIRDWRTYFGDPARTLEFLLS